jgi:chromosome segregation ATPase
MPPPRRPLSKSTKQMLDAMRELYYLETGEAVVVAPLPPPPPPRQDNVDSEVVVHLKHELTSLHHRARSAIAQREATIRDLELELALSRRRRQSQIPPRPFFLPAHVNNNNQDDGDSARLLDIKTKEIARLTTSLHQLETSLTATRSELSQAQTQLVELGGSLAHAREKLVARKMALHDARRERDEAIQALRELEAETTSWMTKLEAKAGLIHQLGTITSSTSR